ncbi:Methyl-CpG-binding domain protein [Vigna angularis]|uniref:Methyl-CpG-binding domain protein n=1 Tax=Phaseolus angularis TaxID=3914 RepID=A0A8T0K3Q0_PHAAN|nr:Methyl-CpG-binding domain protein [Vigna angularis]
MEYVLVLPAQKEGNVIASEKKRRSNKREFHGGREVSLSSVENNFTVDGIIKSKRKKKVDDNKMPKSAKARNFLFKKKREPQGDIKEIINPYSHFYRSQLGFVENNLLVHEKIKMCEPQSDCMEIIDPENMNANDINACVNSKKLEKNLSASEKWNEAYKRVSPDCIWKPPRSETILIQEDHTHDPWRVLVICMLLNRTSGRQTREIVSDFFKLCPDAKSCTQVARKEIEETIKTLEEGFPCLEEQCAEHALQHFA